MPGRLRLATAAHASTCIPAPEHAPVNRRGLCEHGPWTSGRSCPPGLRTGISSCSLSDRPAPPQGGLIRHTYALTEHHACGAGCAFATRRAGPGAGGASGRSSSKSERPLSSQCGRVFDSSASTGLSCPPVSRIGISSSSLSKPAYPYCPAWQLGEGGYSYIQLWLFASLACSQEKGFYYSYYNFQL